MIETERVIYGGDGLLDEPSHRLNHDETVRGLHPGPFQPVVKNRVLVGQQVEAGRAIHDANADVTGVLVGQQ